MTDESLDLSQLFKPVGGVLAQNQTTLNQADDYNHNHGDNMVEIFDVISKAVARKKKEGASSQLAYASQQLRKKSTSGSATVYAQGLEEAAAKFQGQPVTRGNALNLISTLMGASQPQTSGSGDLLGSLLGGAVEQGDGSGIDTADLIQAAMGYFQATQGGAKPLEALVSAVMAGSRMSGSAHREQSGELVVSTLLQALGKMGSK